MARWSEARRAGQAARIREWQPWLKSTGPKTAAGKQRVAQNTISHGACSAEMKEIRAYLRAWRRTLRTLQEGD
ncbi:hypothetical protein [Methylovirgula sp. 4M-Z18]|uniref:hypothetical protein n=1 Tax=Methylovirgula sp. 4M-Z18 TaxID=2293567 RepID=UPI000E2E4D74|nr:hypothetical protein [Methylovirgula sp. 4M-Z18]RFB78946.1 hypothetical protein DYH55_14035 [Methylovirgula sp. 4M-Z18]